ncbi:2Fe-2S iron-sulfur cluster-binding protein [Photorhabdus luminescens]|uniref:2Fe-2S ferredoxin-type domain-containing protein n=1 Tax=Photorhabdus luminescens subsp. mexicana TaxID=2100167 RepID=A0A4R4IYA3_PHOLU|nr:hypothetical protein C5468_21265 [Photorhabdus luminescens subsp. mexicana]
MCTKPGIITFRDDRQLKPRANTTTLLKSLEAYGIEIEYQCWEGYCNSYRLRLLKGAVQECAPDC